MKSSTIYKAFVELSNLNSHTYESFNLTMAKHPSENESRMMYRLVSYLHESNKNLEFTRGLSSTDEPEVWEKGASGEVIHWIEMGEPDEKRIRKVCGKSQKVTIYTYNQNTAHLWFEKIKNKLIGNQKVKIYHIQNQEDFEVLINRSMKLDCLIEDQSLYLSDELNRIEFFIQPQNLT